MPDSPDLIFLRGIDLPAHIGVPDEERATAQVLQADIAIEPAGGFEAMGDAIAATIDYAAVAARVRAEAWARPRRLIETMAADLAQLVLTEFAARSVTVEIRKRILPGVDHVAVRCRRGRSVG